MNLNSSITKVKGISDRNSKLLERLNIFTLRDLLTCFPVRYLDTSNTTLIRDLVLNNEEEELHLLKAKLTEFRSTFIRGGKTVQRGIIDDGSGNIQVSWFNQNFLKNALKVDNEYYFYGKLNKKGNRFSFYPRSFEKVNDSVKSIHLGRIVPEYKLTNGISKKIFRRWVNNALENISEIEINEELRDLVNLPLDIKKSLQVIHFPEDFETLDLSLKTLSIYELVNIYLKLLLKRQVQEGAKPPSISTSFNPENTFTLLKNLIEFELTQDQEKIIKSILSKIKNEELINEIIQGDVGTGKTVIALAASLVMAINGYQTALLAPTTILAKQHYLNFKNVLEKLKIEIELVSSENKKTQSAQILIGTSALMARKNNLITNLGLVIVDEQHKFGVNQREDLLKPFTLPTNQMPHFINMTATPIPRTISQIIFGDIELETIKTKPKGRLPIKTLLVPEQKREDSYEWIKQSLEKGEQVYWICPLIVESENLQAKSAIATFRELEEYFHEYKIGLLHGKLKETEKNQIMEDFSKNKINLLVSTSVIEVGIDVPNANIIIIESSERFGLAQLHQIRGRVGRSDKQSWCLLFYGNNISDSSLNRLKFLSGNSDGMEIAEYDLLNRGPGEIYGTQQSGVPDLKIAKLDNLNTIQNAKILAEKVWEKGIRNLDLFS